MSLQVAKHNPQDYQKQNSSNTNTAQSSSLDTVQYPMFNKQKKWKLLQEQAKKEKKESIDLLTEKSSSNKSSVNKSGRDSPQNKFIFTQKKQTEKNSNTIIKPILTMCELEKMNKTEHDTTHESSTSNSPTSSISISPEPIFEKYENDTNVTNASSEPELLLNTSSSIPITRPITRPHPRPNPRSIQRTSPTRPNSRSSQRPNSRQKNSNSPIEIDISPKREYQLVPITADSVSPTPRSSVSVSPTPMSPMTPMTPMTPMSPVSLYTYKYNLHKNIINTIKELVFQHSALICGAFNSQQFVINEYYKMFQSYILSYQLYNNMTFTSQQINNLFMDEAISPESKIRLDLQNYLEILTTSDRMNSFIDSINKSFTNIICSCKIEHINRGNIKTIIEHSHDLQFYSQNHDGNEIYLHIVKISIPEHSIVFEIRFLILDNEKLKLDKSYVIPLYIPEGLYDAEHLHVTNNGHDVYNIQYSSSSIDYIVNNINMKLVSLMPKINDYDYTKMAKYIKKMMPIPNIPTTTESSYNYEFDIFNTIHKKSDFWLSNKNKEGYQEHNQEHNQEHVCQKCDVVISTNARYVIAKCCYKKYHIECMEMNYYPQYDGIHTYSYLVCDCGCSIIDENSCNSRLLIAFYRNYN
jgi:hypothetical protein